MINSDQVAAQVKKTGADLREGVANITGDRDAKVLAQKDRIEGEAQKSYGDAKQAIKNVTE
jgi:uncharacterized protein YjbJ (UPF0337 family)